MLHHPTPGCSPAESDDASDQALLGLLIYDHPGLWSLSELDRSLTPSSATRLAGRRPPTGAQPVAVERGYREPALTTESAWVGHTTNFLLEVEGFSADDAAVVAELWAPTRVAGLSLAARVCLALARRLDLPAHTADREWQKVDVGVEVILIR